MRLGLGRKSLLAAAFLAVWHASGALADAPPTPPTPKPDPMVALLKPCTEGKDAGARAAACTNLIASGQLNGNALAAAYVFRGNTQVERREFKAAVDDFSKALSIDSAASDALYNRAAAYAMIGRFDLAQEDYGRLLKLVPGDPDTLFNRARLYAIQGQYDTAIDDLSKVLMAKPDDFETRLWRVGLAIMLGRNEDAIADCDRLLKAAPTSPAALYNRGRAEYLARDYDAAAQDFADTVKNLNGISTASLRVYAALRLALAAGHSGKGIPAELQDAAKDLPQDQWPMPIVAFYLGTLSAEDLLAAAHGAAADKAAQTTAEAEYYVGEWARLKGDNKAARAHFKAALAAKADAANLEFIDAGLELKKLRN